MEDRLIKRVIFNQFGDAQELKVVFVPIPEPNENEVRIKVLAIGVNRAEELYRNGTYFDSPQSFPASLGYEASGIIDKVGNGVNQFKNGDSVSLLVNFKQSIYSSYGEYIVIHVDHVIHNPKGLSHKEASSIWMSYLTAYFALNHQVKIVKGDWIVITAASSSAALGAIQISKILGANVIATSRTSEKKSDILSYGVDHFIATQEEDIEKKILEYTDGKGANIIFDPVGGKDFPKLVNSLAHKGTVIVYGILSTDITPYPILPLFIKQAQIQSYVLIWYSNQKELIKEATDFILFHLEKGSFKSIVGREFKGIDSIPDSHKYLATKSLFGKVVIEL